MHRSRHPITIRMAPKAELTSDHFVILPKARVVVDSPRGSFFQYFRDTRDIAFPVPTYFRQDMFGRARQRQKTPVPDVVKSGVS